jgi:hypothetical protein
MAKIMALLLIIIKENLVNCWKLSPRQSAAKLEREGSTTIRKEYTQVSGSARHLIFEMMI